MRILITGATGTLGRTVAAQLSAAGHRVCGLASRPHPLLDPRVELVCATPGDAILHELSNNADAVVHLAPIEPGVTDGAGLDGVVQVSHAAARAGARLLFVSQAAGDPELYGEAEELVESAWTPSLIIRIAAPVGRHADWMVSRTAATLLATDITRPVRVLHTDDLVRFLVRSVGSHRTGSVDLATAETVTAASARRWLTSLASRGHVDTWPQLDADLRLVPLHRDWEFDCGWTAADAIADTGRAVPAGGYPPLPTETIPRDVTITVSGRPAAPRGIAGDFDDLIDPHFPVFSVRCTSDALPGPLTPMTLDVQGGGLRAAQCASAQFMGLSGGLAYEWQQRAVGVFGHRIFTGVSATLAAAALLPGGIATLDHSLTDAASADQQRRRPPRPFADAALTARMVILGRRYGGWCQEFAATATSFLPAAQGWPALTDAVLDTRIRLLRNRIHQGWTLSMVGALAEGLFCRATGQDRAVVPLLAATTATAHLATETAALAHVLRADEKLRELAAGGDLAAIRSAAPEVAAAVDAALSRVGHRGPGEAELANPVLAQSPGHLLVAAALAALDSPSAPVATAARTGRAQRRAEEIRLARESAWDATARYTDQLRIALRERGIRLAAVRMLAQVDDVFYLTLDEVLAPPVDARLRVDRRRREHVRLQALHMPDVIHGAWAPIEDEVLVDTAAEQTPDVAVMEPQGQS